MKQAATITAVVAGAALVGYLALTPAPAPAPFVTRLEWSQPDACAGWAVFGYDSNNTPVLVTNIARPLYGDTWQFTIVSPYAFNTIRSYTR